MESSTILLLVLLVSLLVGFGISIVLVRGGRSRAAARLAEVPGPVLRTVAATSFGVESEGATQLRGTGTLVLTADEVAFAQWRPDRLLRIARRDLTTVDTTQSHLGKTMKQDLLRLAWTHEGAEDRVAFFVRDLDPWLGDLGGTRQPPPDPA